MAHLDEHLDERGTRVPTPAPDAGPLTALPTDGPENTTPADPYRDDRDDRGDGIGLGPSHDPRTTKNGR